MNIWTFDFETQKIDNSQPGSPAPVGYALKKNDEPSVYYAWDHPTENNTTAEEAYEILKNSFIADTESFVVMHNAKFDLEVLSQHMDLEPQEHQVQDTMVLAFLSSPNASTLGLKPLSDTLLNMPPDEQTELRDWIVANVKKATEKNWGAFIADAPAGIVGKYAVGDTDRTKALFDLLYNKIEADVAVVKASPLPNRNSMFDAYRTEIAMINVIRKMEREGVKLASNTVSEANYWHREYEECEATIRAVVGHEVTIGGKLMFNKLKELGLIDESSLQYTPKGNPRYGREFLPALVTDQKLVAALTKRSKLTKMLGTYLKPWAQSYAQNNGRYYPYFNSTRNLEDRGTRTGRLSSNFQQVPKVPQDGFPNLREFVVPDHDDEVLIVFDFSAQELRIAANYAEGSILEAYQKDPDVDLHGFIQELILNKTGHDLSRRVSKTISFLKLFGGGPGKLVDQIDCTLDEAKQFFASYDEAIPEFKQLSRDLEQMVRGGSKLRTWGGRLYDVEPSEIREDGRKWEKYYKLSNTLIQGSAADMTKHSMTRYDKHPDRKGRLLLQVHDELVVSVKKEYAKSEVEVVRWSMEEHEGFDVPVKADGDVGYSYAHLTPLADWNFDTMAPNK